MAVPTLITDLSTTALDNAPTGEDAPSVLDNIQRAHASFIAKLRDESQTLVSKDASGGYAGLTLFKLNLKNAANTFTNFLTNATTAARTWTMPDKDGTVAMLNDFAAPPAIGGTTPAAGAFTTLIATTTSAGAVTYPQTVMNSDASSVGTGAGINFVAYNSVGVPTGSIANVRDASGQYSLRFSTFFSAALTEVFRLRGTGGVDVSSGGLTVTSAALLGYGVGAGGTATQPTSKTTGVTLNKPSGQITMNNAAIAAGGVAIFALTNSLIGAADSIVCHHDGVAGTLNAYAIQVLSTGVGGGSINLRLVNITAGSLSEALTLTFKVIKGANA